MADLFRLDGRVAVVTGGAGLLGAQHADVIAAAGGHPVLLDIDAEHLEHVSAEIQSRHGVRTLGVVADVSRRESLEEALARVLGAFGSVDILINNAARNPKVEGDRGGQKWSHFEHYPLGEWERDVAVGLTGAVLASQVFGAELANRGRGVILNVASDLGVIAPDQRIYRRPGVPDDQQPVKPVSYSVVKHGLIGLTKYLATYWAHRGVRVNALSPGGVYAGQDSDFVERLTNLIPLGRMANLSEYQGAVLFLVSDASSYMTGANLVMDGGRSVW